MFLTPAELQELTGYKRAMDQCRWMRKRGWTFELNNLNRPVVLRAHAEAKLGSATPAATPAAAPNFAALHERA